MDKDDAMTMFRLTLVACALAMCLAGCRSRPPEGKPQVVATIFPLQDVTRQIAGDDAQVDSLLPPGRSPHGYSLTTQQVEALGKARLMIMVGKGIDEWAERAVGARGGELAVLRLINDEQLSQHLKKSDDEHEGHEGHRHDHGDHGDIDDPHIWLDPVFMQRFCRLIADKLAGMDAAHKDQYFQRRDDYIQKLKELDAEYARELAPFKGQKIVTYHTAFTYICRRYGLEQVNMYTAAGEAFGTDTERQDRIVKMLESRQVKVIFLEPQYQLQSGLKERLEKAKVKIAVLDPQGDPRKTGYDSYIALMRSNLKTIVESLR